MNTIWLRIWKESLHEFIPNALCDLIYYLISLVCLFFEKYREGTSTLLRVVVDHFGDISTLFLALSTLKRRSSLPHPAFHISFGIRAAFGSVS